MKQVLSILSAGILLSSMVACAGTDNRSKEQVKIPMDKAVALAQEKVQGQLIQTRMAEVGDRSFYQIEIRDQYDMNRWVLVDANDGSIIERQTRPRLKY